MVFELPSASSAERNLQIKQMVGKAKSLLPKLIMSSGWKVLIPAEPPSPPLLHSTH